MSNGRQQLIKVFLEYLDENTQSQDYESLWAFKLEEGVAKLDNIPFLAKHYADDDVVRYETRDGMNIVTGLVEASGHSCIQVIFFDIDQKEKYRSLLKELGCESEGSHIPELISVDVPPDADYEAKVRPLLQDAEDAEILSYREACLERR